MLTLKQIVRSQSFAGILLFCAALLAIAFNNSSLEPYYEAFINTRFSIQLGSLALSKPLLLWINDGLMAVFFLLVGLEIKREMLSGVLRNLKTVILPTAGAIGGLMIPALIYAAINYNNPIALKGWAVPVATDIAFSLGILSLLGSRVHSSVKIFLTALAIIDDIAAIIIIAIFYTYDLSVTSLVIAMAMVVLLVLMNRLGVKRIGPYCIVGLILWVSVLKSGIHATLAGIVLAFAIPIDDGSGDATKSPLINLEHTLLPWVSYLVLPLFAFANTGFSFKGLHLYHILYPIPLGIALGLFAGKQLGIFATCYTVIKSGLAKLPDGMDLGSLYGVALLCGVGFTMSLFIGALAFGDTNIDYARYVKMGVLVGSLLSGIAGYAFLRVRSGKTD